MLYEFGRHIFIGILWSYYQWRQFIVLEWPQEPLPMIALLWNAVLKSAFGYRPLKIDIQYNQLATASMKWCCEQSQPTQWLKSHLHPLWRRAPSVWCHRKGLHGQDGARFSLLCLVHYGVHRNHIYECVPDNRVPSQKQENDLPFSTTPGILFMAFSSAAGSSTPLGNLEENIWNARP